MPSLRDLQRGFAAVTVFGDSAALAGLGIVGDGIAAASRMAIYRNNVFGNYRKALAATYPVVRRLAGAPFFDAAIEAFVREHPSTRGDVNRYGGDLPRFLTTYGPTRMLRYLPDVARLEWAIDQANIAGDAGGLDLAALAGVAADAWSELRFVLHPSARLVVSIHPILHIWRVNQPDSAGDESADLGKGGEQLLVLRTVHGVTIERLDAGEHALLATLSAGVKLADAARRAEDADPAFDLAVALQRYVAAHAIVAFRAPDTAKGPRR
jgi:hypothetical protein